MTGGITIGGWGILLKQGLHLCDVKERKKNVTEALTKKHGV